MTAVNTLIAVCLAYVAFLFAIAFVAERQSARGKAGWLRSPLVYTLSLSIYCTAWTFYGAVGYAARSGMEFVTIYLGPSLVMIGWWWVLRRLVRIGRAQGVTSVADLISSRYGKSNSLAIIVTVMGVIGVTPYIALQLQSVSESLATFASGGEGQGAGSPAAGLWIAVGLALFTVLFGTRNLNANERHDGVVIAIAVEAIVKLVALLAVGAFVVWWVAGGVGPMMAQIDASELGQWNVDRSRWIALMAVSAAAFLCLPRMFQVLVVENDDERHLQVASWAFPVYLMAMSLFVVPIAGTGLNLLPDTANPDMFVMTVPMSQGKDGLAMLAFLGGFSSATSMVIVATLALSTMVSNHIVMPIWLTTQGDGASVSGDVRNVVIFARRVSILMIIALGYLYYQMSGGSAALAAIGLISFVGVSQFLPAMIGGIFWRGATRAGAIAGLSVGFALWAFTSLLPSFGPDGLIPAHVFQDGLFGLGILRPQALFGIGGIDATVHAIVWSLSINTGVFILVSLFSFPKPLERLQGAQFVNVFDHSGPTQSWRATAAASEDLMIMSQRILGAREAQALFQDELQKQGGRGDLPDVTPGFLQRLERELSASVGTATAHAMIAQLVGGSSVTVEDLMAVADESAQILEYSSRLEAKSEELAQTALQLREANDMLTALSVQKDAFLSQISHELRTPMTSIRAFSEILRDEAALSADDQTKFASIIHGESLRLTRLLDDLLDLSVLENGEVSLNLEQGDLSDLIDTAIMAVSAGNEDGIAITHKPEKVSTTLTTDHDRLVQVFINLISNAQKYCDVAKPKLDISIEHRSNGPGVVFQDNGTPIAADARKLIFEKFSRLADHDTAGAGLGLAICKEVMARLGGDVRYEVQATGNRFVVMLPADQALAAQ